MSITLYAISVPKLILIRNIFFFHIVYAFECQWFLVLTWKIITVVIITEVIILPKRF